MDTSFWARTDSNSAGNPALNLTKADALEIKFVWSSPTSGGGDVILEANGGLPDDTSMVEVGGVEYSFTFEYTGTLPTTKPNGSQQVPDQLEGENIYLISVHDYPTVGETVRFAFLPDYDATEAEMNDFGKGAIDIQDHDDTPAPSPVCFARGTMIATPRGEMPIELLSAGDMVMTSSGKSVRLEWISLSHFSYAEMLFNKRVCPVLVPKNHFGPDKPHTDLWVSPQHRIVVRGWNVELALGEAEALVAAKHIIGQPGFPTEVWRSGVDYFHLLLDHHDVLVSNGLESESMLIGEEVLRSLKPQTRHLLENFLDENPRVQASARLPIMSIAKSSEAILMRPEAEMLKGAA
jgi:hypothetical protein